MRELLLSALEKVKCSIIYHVSKPKVFGFRSKIVGAEIKKDGIVLLYKVFGKPDIFSEASTSLANNPSTLRFFSPRECLLIGAAAAADKMSKSSDADRREWVTKLVSELNGK